MSHDIQAILIKMDGITEALDKQQQSVRQLPALFQPKDTSPQLSGPYPGRNATRGYLVGESDDGVNPMAQAVTRRIMNQHPEWLMKYGAGAVRQAISDVIDSDDDWEEIGSSDVSAYVNYVGDYLRDHHASRDEMDHRRPFAEGTETATEDVISTMKKRLGDYLQDMATAIKKDSDLISSGDRTSDTLKSVKTLRTDDGHEIKIVGNEDDGFRVSIRNRTGKTRFQNLDEAVMACEMYCARRRKNQASQDYIEEA